MNIKKYTGKTEQEAILKAKEELGNDAIVLNIKKENPRGIYRFFKKTTVEVTVAVDENKKETTKLNSFQKQFSSISNDAVSRGDVIVDEKPKPIITEPKESAIEQKLNRLQALLEKQMTEETVTNAAVEPEQKPMKKEEKKNPYVSLILEQLENNEVAEDYAKQIIHEVENTFKRDASIDNILSSVYQKIVLKLGQPETIHIDKEKTKYIFFIGPTGVGKTTTIAKIASSLKINEHVNVALVTLDTYRIAAVEQLRTYANILGIPLKVAYAASEMKKVSEEYSDYDIVLVDTAGRSHKNAEQCDELDHVINSIAPDQREVYLVLSATTKYKDLVNIVKRYHDITNFNIIFTKLDETMCVGNILNIRMMTNAPLSYVTCGQNVPDDIGMINAQDIAKQLLGGSD